jgi:hypothetical protein
MSFFVYQNWHRVRARLHRGNCSHCNDGRGTQPNHSGANDEWHGPFKELNHAQTLMASFGYSDSRGCRICLP